MTEIKQLTGPLELFDIKSILYAVTGSWLINIYCMSIKQHCILLFALLAFIGQSMAAVQVSCSAMDMENVAGSDMMHMDHSMHDMQSHNDQPESACDCCGDIECPMIQCGVLSSAIVDGVVMSSMDLLSESVIDTRAGNTSSDAKPLFRPPISH